MSAGIKNKRAVQRSKLTKLLNEVKEAAPGEHSATRTSILLINLGKIEAEYAVLRDALAETITEEHELADLTDYDNLFSSDVDQARGLLMERNRADTPSSPAGGASAEGAAGQASPQLAEILGKFVEQQHQLTVQLAGQREVDENGAPVNHVAAFKDILEKIVDQQGEFAKQVSESARITANSSASTNASGSQATNIVVQDVRRLPPLTLHKFSGQYKDWPEFEDLFTATVINDKVLSDAERLSYLKGVLEGDALSEVRNCTITNENFKPAWERLLTRFKKEKHIIGGLVTSLVEQPAIQKPSAASIRAIVQRTQEVFDSLKAIATTENKAEGRDPWVKHLILTKLDSRSKELWATHSAGKKNPTVEELLEFLRNRCESLEANPTQEKRADTGANNRPIRAHVTEVERCAQCNGAHRLFECSAFKGLSQASKQSAVTQNRLCFNCLRKGHGVASCTSRSVCRKCQRKHHTLLCTKETISGPGGGATQASTSGGGTSTTSVLNPATEPFVSANVAQPCSATNRNILPTALVNVRDKFGRHHAAVCLLDTGSQSSFISEALAQKLHLERSGGKVNVTGIGGQHAGTTNGRVQVVVVPRSECREVFETNAFVLSKLTSLIPDRSFELPDTNAIRRMRLADPEFNKVKQIDMILGPEVLFRAMRSGKQWPWGRSGPIAVDSAFGWILSGQSGASDDDSEISASTAMLTIGNEETLERQLRAFWEVEEVRAGGRDDAAEEVRNGKLDIFSRAPDGRFVARLPIEETAPPLGESYAAALACFRSLERRFAAKPELKIAYRKFITEYQELGHMERVPDNEVHLPEGRVCYLPHHDVHNEASTTTKLRVVFNASKLTSSGVSLNSRLIVGPVVQRDLVSILLDFRMHRFVVASDIEKMYRQIAIASKDADLQRIVWRDHPDDPIQHWRLVTVVYGTASASYCATKPLQILANEHRASHPRAAEVIDRNMYVDDCMFGDDDLEALAQKQQEVIEILKSGCFNLRKWAANHPYLLENIPPENREMEPHELDFGDHTRKTLGIVWHPKSDVFTYKVNLQDHETMTKRKFLSETAKLFDPFGWISPVVVRAKIDFQRLWHRDVEWDDPLPDDILTNWRRFIEQAPQIAEIEVPRWVPNTTKTIELHGFADASTLAYAAVIYARTVDDAGNEQVRLLISKTKVAPIKTMTVPRLELSAALLLSRLAKKVLAAIQPLKPKFFAYSDSTVVLAWLSASPRKWATFVQNRCGEILEQLPRSTWSHVQGVENPADLASRGLSPSELLDSQLWWQGPPWLSQPRDAWPVSIRVEADEQADLEARPESVQLFVAQHGNDLLIELQQRISSYSRLLRVTALVFRFIHNCSRKRLARQSWTQRKGRIVLTELNSAEIQHIQASQALFYSDEIRHLRKGQEIGRKSRILNLSPRLHEDILRVGGRLDNANLPLDRKHPIIVHPDSHLAKLLVVHYHLLHLHASPTLLVNILRFRFWIPRSRALVRNLIQKCLTCFKASNRPITQKMGALPPPRVTEQPRCLVHTGVDYTGPIKVRPSSGRGNTTLKGYVCVFICLTSRAIHLECVPDLSTQAFLKALKRFISRRGYPSILYSDCGTNFKGAVRILNENREEAIIELNTDEVRQFLTPRKIEWRFNPPSAPHMGGSWEAGVKSFKLILGRVLQDKTLTFEEYATVLAEIEACLNSRPLCPLTDDPSSLDALTPGHLLTLEPPLCLPEPAAITTPISRLDRYAQLRRIVEDYWRRWSVEYVSSLQPRSKWHLPTENLAIGDLVLVRDDNAPPAQWITARITALHPGKDGLVRVVTVRHPGGQYKRPVTKLSKLPIN